MSNQIRLNTYQMLCGWMDRHRDEHQGGLIGFVSLSIFLSEQYHLRFCLISFYFWLVGSQSAFLFAGACFVSNIFVDNHFRIIPAESTPIILTQFNGTWHLKLMPMRRNSQFDSIFNEEEGNFNHSNPLKCSAAALVSPSLAASNRINVGFVERHEKHTSSA